MRENVGLFKAKRKSTKDWVTGYLYIKGRKAYIIVVSNNSESNKSIISEKLYLVDPETLCECIGQPDKNNKLIFENDKLRCAVEDPCTGKIYKYFDCIVKYCKTTNAWGWYGIDERSVLNKIPPQQNHIEVIGNIFNGGNCDS